MNSKQLCQTAKDLTGGNQFKRLALLSVGVMLAANLLSLLVDALVGSLMQDATGLSMLGKRTMLMGFQSIVQLLITVALPFWSYGFYKVAMYAARKASPDNKTLLWGFRRFGPLLRLFLLEILIATGFVFLGTWLSCMVYMMTPWAEAVVLEQISPILQDAEALAADPEALNALLMPVMDTILKALWPMYVLIVVVLCVLLIPWLYKVRLAPYHILDGENSALAAMAKSQQEMRGNRLSMFKLDLRWWWYYGLLYLAAAPLYVYGFVGGEQWLFWVLTLGSYGLQLLVQWQLLPRVQTSYALAYDILKTKVQNPPFPAPPVNQ